MLAYACLLRINKKAWTITDSFKTCTAKLAHSHLPAMFGPWASAEGPLSNVGIHDSEETDESAEIATKIGC